MIMCYSTRFLSLFKHEDTWKSEIVRVLSDLTLISLERNRERARSIEQLA